MKKEKNPAAVALGSLGGKAKSERKTTSSRENGKKGGRPIACIICKARFTSYAEKQRHYREVHGAQSLI